MLINTAKDKTFILNKTGNIMRKRFEQQTTLGRHLIEDTVIPTAKRMGSMSSLCAALKEIFINPEWNEKIFTILEKAIYPKNNTNGRPGMDLWMIFVLAEVRLCQNIGYEELCDQANHHKLIRQLMGVEGEWGTEQLKISYQNIVDNVALLDDNTVKELNEVILAFGHSKLKKKETAPLQLKTDSFVVETNVHFPTDYNLLWDSARKCTDIIIQLQKTQKIPGWRKMKEWRRVLKNQMRLIGRIYSQGGRTKKERLKQVTQDNIDKSKALVKKIQYIYEKIQINTKAEMKKKSDLKKYMICLIKQIDQMERRIIKGEKIPHSEKTFSIFENYTEWIKKGKRQPEMGKKVSITTDETNLIVDYRIMEKQSDNAVVTEIAEKLLPEYKISSWSFDKGFWKPENRDLLKEKVKHLVLPKNGKYNAQERKIANSPIYKERRNKHSAIESNINELEHRGLNRCPDKGYQNFKKYVGLAVSAYNLKKIGKYLIEEQRFKEQKVCATAA